MQRMIFLKLDNKSLVYWIFLFYYVHSHTSSHSILIALKPLQTGKFKLFRSEGGRLVWVSYLGKFTVNNFFIDKNYFFFCSQNILILVFFVNPQLSKSVTSFLNMRIGSNI